MTPATENPACITVKLIKNRSGFAEIVSYAKPVRFAYPSQLLHLHVQPSISMYFKSTASVLSMPPNIN